MRNCRWDSAETKKNRTERNTMTTKEEQDEKMPMPTEEVKGMKGQINAMIELVKLSREQQREHSKLSDKRLEQLEEQLMDLKVELKRLKQELKK